MMDGCAVWSFKIVARPHENWHYKAIRATILFHIYYLIFLIFVTFNILSKYNYSNIRLKKGSHTHMG